tara:strand:+ start:49 stop:297 length:249 start_codon:yes stop_codon:yes gene_type:complete
MGIKKLRITRTTHRVLFALIMSFVTSSTVSFIVVMVTKGFLDGFINFWIPSLFRSWPIVFILILVFVPLINKFLDTFFTKDA